MKGDAQVIPLVGNGANQTVAVGERDWQWQLQYRNGKPMGNLEHYGHRKGGILFLPAIPNGAEYQLLLVEKG